MSRAPLTAAERAERKRKDALWAEQEEVGHCNPQSPPRRPGSPLTPEARAASDNTERAELRAALAAASGNVAATARALAVKRRTLDRRINALGLRDWLDGYDRSVRQLRRGGGKEKA